jgi:hypothetical protein
VVGWHDYVSADDFRKSFDITNNIVRLGAEMAFMAKGLRSTIAQDLSVFGLLEDISITTRDAANRCIAFQSTSRLKRTKRGAKASAKAILPTIGITAARTLTIPVAPFVKRSTAIGNPLPVLALDDIRDDPDADGDTLPYGW